MKPELPTLVFLLILVHVSSFSLIPISSAIKCLGEKNTTSTRRCKVRRRQIYECSWGLFSKWLARKWLLSPFATHSKSNKSTQNGRLIRPLLRYRHTVLLHKGNSKASVCSSSTFMTSATCYPNSMSGEFTDELDDNLTLAVKNYRTYFKLSNAKDTVNQILKHCCGVLIWIMHLRANDDV